MHIYKQCTHTRACMYVRRRLFHQNEGKVQRARLEAMKRAALSSTNIITAQEENQSIMERKLLEMKEKLAAEEQLGTRYQDVSKRAYESQGVYLRGQVEYYKNAVADCKKVLKETRKVAYKAKRTAKKHAEGNSKAATSRLSAEAQMRIAAANMSTVIALEAAEAASDKGKGIVKENVKLRLDLEASKEMLQATKRKLEETTPWVDLLGKKGQRYDMYILETVLILMSLGSTATDACSSFSVFLERSYPHLKAGVDYRVPGDWYFKEVAEIIYPLGVAASRKLADECIRMYVGLDGSPRDGFTYFGLSYRLVLPASYVDDGEESDVVLNCAASLSLLPNQLHRTEADATVRAVGERNLLKMPAVSVDCAAESVAKLVFEEKAKVVEELKRNEAAFVAGLTPMQVELMDTKFIVKCQRHIDQLYSGNLIKNEGAVQIRMHVQWNFGRRIQVWMLGRVLLRKSNGGNKAVRVKLWVRAITNHYNNRGLGWKKLPERGYTFPMATELQSMKEGKPIYKHYLTESPPNIWSGLCSMSNLCASRVRAFPFLSPPSAALPP